MTDEIYNEIEHRLANIEELLSQTMDLPYQKPRSDWAFVDIRHVQLPFLNHGFQIEMHWNAEYMQMFAKNHFGEFIFQRKFILNWTCHSRKDLKCDECGFVD